MRKLVTWVAVTLGIAALVRKLRRRSAEAERSPEPASGDPAAELREKLAESRADAGAAAVTPEAPTSTADERRAEVQEEGRAVLEEMRSTDDDA